MSLINEVVFTNSNSPIIWTINDSAGIPIKFVTNGVTKIELFIGGAVVSSITGDITYNDSGVVTINIPDNAGVTLYRKYEVTLKVYDPLHPKGQVVINREFPQSSASIKISSIP